MLSEKPWRIEAVVQLVLALFLFLCGGSAVVGLLREFGGERFQDSSQFLYLLIGTLSLHGAMLVLIAVFLRRHQVSWAEAFGLRSSRLARALTIAFAVACVAIPLTWALQALSIDILNRLGWEPEPQTAVTMIRNTPTWWKRAYLGVFTIAMAPVVEEFIFRGLMYPLFKRCVPRFLAWTGVSLIFALCHFNLATLLPLFGLAMVLTWLYEETDILLAPVLVHALFNAANFIMLLQMDNVFQNRP